MDNFYDRRDIVIFRFLIGQGFIEWQLLSTLSQDGDRFVLYYNDEIGSSFLTRNILNF